MNRRSIVCILSLAVLVALSAAWMPVSAAPRQCVILEGFTQWNCGPCANWNPQELTLLNQMTRDTVISVKYHGWWPGANNDPFHLWNVSETTTRINMYGVSGVPDSRIDGYITPTFGNVSSFRNHIRSQFAMNCPCSIDIAALAQGETSIYFTGSVDVEVDMGGARIFVALLTDHEQGPPYGSNGETAWYDVFRDLAPNANQGILVTALAGQTQTFEGTLNREAEWDIDNMTVVAWVQDLGSREIYQGTISGVTQDYGMLTTTEEPYQKMISPSDDEITYSVDVQNLGNLEDSYIVELVGDFPAGWTHTIEAEGVTAHESSISVPLQSLESTEVIVRLNPNGNRGFCEFGVSLQSPNEPLVHSSHDFRIMGGLSILLVDDDDGDEYETYFYDALESFAESMSALVGVWDVSRDYLDETYFGSTDLIVWLTGNSFQDGQTLSALDQLVLGDYLNAGGRLFLSGQGIGADIRTDQFMSDHLHTRYKRNWPQGQQLYGYASDPIGDGLDFAISGGDGANNQGRQCLLASLDEFATPILRYSLESDTMDAAMRIAADDYRVVYLGFGLEAVADEQSRTTLMERSLEWLYEGLAADEPPTETVPVAFALGQNYPNPFNPETSIPYTLADRSMVTLKVYDVLGREVVSLISGVQEAGVHTVNWNASALSSGIYFYALEAVSGDNSFRSTRKLVLMK